MIKIKHWLLRWQEHAIFLPIMVAVGLMAWVVLGTLDRTAAVDSMADWIGLPLRTAYAVAAIALTYTVRRRWRRKLNDEEQKIWWDKVLESSPGAIAILIIDAVVTLCALYFLLKFFSLPA